MDIIDKKAEKPTTISFDEQLLGLAKALESLEHKIDKLHPNWVETIALTNTNRTTLPLQSFTGTIPLQKLEVIAVGGGLTLWINNQSYGIPVSIGSTIEAEISNLQYQVTSGTAYILIYARIN